MFGKPLRLLLTYRRRGLSNFDEMQLVIDTLAKHGWNGYEHYGSTPNHIRYTLSGPNGERMFGLSYSEMYRVAYELQEEREV